MKKNRFTYLFIIFLMMTGSVFAQVQNNEELSGKSAFIQGMEAFANNELETARELLLRAHEDLDEAAGVSYALADLFLSLNNLPEAARYGKKAIADNADHKWYRLKLAQIYRSAGKNEATLAELQTLIKYHPNDFDARYMLADTYKDYGEFVKANQVLNDILALTGPDAVVYLAKFQNFEALRQRDSAVVQLENIREIEPDNLKALNMLGEYYARTGKDDQAKNVLNEALERNSRDPQSLINLAAIYLDAEKWDSAGTLLANFVSDPLVEPEQKLNISQFLYSRTQENPENIHLNVQTKRVMDAFAESEPEYAPAFTLSGQFLAQTGDSEKALEMLKKANELLPEDDIAWRQRLQLLLSQNQLNEAVEVGQVADQKVPDDAFIQFFIGSAYMLKSEHIEAERWLEKATRAPARRPFKSTIYGTLGDVRANLENYEASDQAYETALRYHPENDNAMNNYAYNLSVREENLERAEELALKAIEIAPENSSYLDTVGWVYFKLGDFERAKRFIKAAIDTGAASAEILEHMGDIYEQLNDMNEAYKWWELALEKDSTRTHLENKIQ
ncbi:MAG: tetratricopeptide repeat protein [Balneolaceae bacterium]